MTESARSTCIGRQRRAGTGGFETRPYTVILLRGQSSRRSG